MSGVCIWYKSILSTPKRWQDCSQALTTDWASSLFGVGLNFVATFNASDGDGDDDYDDDDDDDDAEEDVEKGSDKAGFHSFIDLVLKEVEVNAWDKWGLWWLSRCGMNSESNFSEPP